MTATVILTLIAVLLMFLGGLLDGLIRSSTGAVRAQQADAIVYAESAQASFLRSRIDPTTRAEIEALPAVEQSGGLGVVLLGARVPGNGPRDLANIALWGYELAPRGVPAPPDDGEAWADRVLEADGVELGDVLLVGPARSPVTVVGWVEDTSYTGQAGLWANVDTWHAVLSVNRPDAALADGVFQALAVRGADVVAAIETGLGGRVEALTIDDAVNAIPGVTEQRTTFNQILGVTVVVALVVIALFFALLTVERTALYGVLKAVGARSGTIFLGLVVQAMVVTLVAAAVAGAAVVVLDLLIPPGSIPLSISATRIVISVVLLLVAAVVGSAFSLRRVLRVDPASALGSSS
ncbi:MAG: FtsX-like permease family protein [Ilumatobacter sp.]|uniref:FtsX-like permease family protein n=1 Tax=Ilumatobacter sp. TaxID=1967498 RepID=UPI002606BBE5|nr:FtsX-like permease family protein [Ilumatobacter sp.]MDJ0771483.1 FtsX-like permease family protein [Ilumatobacter sp.]